MQSELLTVQDILKVFLVRGSAGSAAVLVFPRRHLAVTFRTDLDRLPSQLRSQTAAPLPSFWVAMRIMEFWIVQCLPSDVAQGAGTNNPFLFNDGFPIRASRPREDGGVIQEGRELALGLIWVFSSLIDCVTTGVAD